MEGTISLFGFPSTTADLKVLPRSALWRVGWASVYWGGALVLSTLVGLIPPHAPWVVAALGIGGYMGWRRWLERFTILSLHGLCPKCGGSLGLPRGTPLRPLMTLTCQGCNHDPRLHVDPTEMRGTDRERQ